MIVAAQIPDLSNRLTLMGLVPRGPNETLWGVYGCECGWLGKKRAKDVGDGKTRSCGCLRRESTGVASRTHGNTCGRAHSATYSTWSGMINRCASSLVLGRNYKARGISVCPQWKDFTVFLRDMGERPSGMTLDRIDNNGDYTPENCRWATTAQQARNTSRSRLVFYEGRDWNMCDLADRVGIKFGTLWCRLSRYGWTVERAISAPVRGKS